MKTVFLVKLNNMKRYKRIKQIKKGGIWGDARGNKVQILKLKGGKVYFKVLYIDEERNAVMEDRHESMPVRSFVAPTGFQCESETGRPKLKIV